MTLTPTPASPAVKALRKTWRKSREHYQAQVIRFLSLLGGLLAAQAVNDIQHHHRIFSEITDANSLFTYLVPVGYVAWRQVHPALTAAQVDSAPGATIVPEQVGVVNDGLPVEPTPVQTDNGPRPEDGDQSDVSQDPNVIPVGIEDPFDETDPAA